MSRERANPKTNRLPLPRIRIATASYLAFGILAAASWGYILGASDSGIPDLFQRDTWSGVGDFLGRLAGLGLDSKPAFLTAEAWARGGHQAIDTLAMSVLAIGIAGAAVLLTFIPAARNVAFGELSGSGSWAGKPVYFLLRGAFAFSRGVPELLWAMIIVFMLSPGILPGAIALAVHNYGIVGKLGAEVVENLDPRPARALRASGANGFQLLAYGILPQALPRLLTFLLYRWEVVIRTTIVVGFVAAGGLGHEFRLRMSWFHYDEITLLLLYYLLLVMLVDLVSAALRRLAR